MKEAILILGMHRSGTSMLSGMIHQAGYALGKDLMGADESNPKGHYENLAVYSLNERMLEESGSAWDDLSAKVVGLSSQLVAGYVDDAVKVIEDQFGGAEKILIKDPRNCLLFPVWSEALRRLGILQKVIFTYRNPLEVAYSLQARNHFSVAKGLQLWCNHLLYGEYLSRGCGRAFVAYEDGLQDPQGELKKIDEQLGLGELPQISEEEADRSLRHQTVTYKELDRNLPAQILALVDLVRAGGFEDEQTLDGIRKEYELYRAFFITEESQLTASQKEEVERVSQHRDQLILKNKGFHTELQKKSQEITSLKEGLATRGKEVESLNNALAEKQAELDNMNQVLSERDSHIADLEQHHEHRVIALEAEKAHLNNNLDLYHELSVLCKESAFDYARILDKVFTTSRWRLGNKVYTGLERLIGKKKTIIDTSFRSRLGNMSQEVARIESQLKRGFSLPEKTGESSDDLKSRFTQEKQEEFGEFLASETDLLIPSCDKPRVSIILVLYNRAELSFKCIESIIAHCTDTYELIVVDNASSDQTDMLLDRLMGGVKVIANQDNVGFLRACNQAAHEAVGDYILLLNNDAEIYPQAIENALEVFEQEPDVGAVGGKIVLLDGTLQEAGSIIWNQGSCLGYGRGDDPMSPAYNFRREVDYCSGAFLMTPAGLWNELGGFDSRFEPAYYEETDYCVSLREQGYRILYEPSAVIKHFEFASQDALEQGNRLALMQGNQKKFLDKHQQFLADSTLEPDLANVPRARIAAGRKRVLYIDDRVPHLSHGAGFPRSNFIANTLSEMGLAVTLIPLNFAGEDDIYSAYSDMSRNIEIQVNVGRNNFAEYAEQWANAFDYVWISRPHNMAFMRDFIDSFKQAGARIIYDAEALFSLRDKEKAKVLGIKNIGAAKALEDELALTKGVDTVVSVSEYEAATFRASTDAEVVVLGHAVEHVAESAGGLPFAERSGLLFVGNMDYDDSPNVDSVEWFVDEVFPAVREAIPDIELVLVGTDKSPKIQQIGRRDGVVLKGRQESLDEFFNQARVFIAPTRYAAGIPHKVHEAAGRGLPVVATTLLAKQLGWQTGIDLIAVDWQVPEDFARCVVDLYSNELRWNAIRISGSKQLIRDCSIKEFVMNLGNIIS